MIREECYAGCFNLIKEKVKVAYKKPVKTFLINFFYGWGSERLQTKNELCDALEKCIQQEATSLIACTIGRWFKNQRPIITNSTTSANSQEGTMERTYIVGK